MTKTIKLMIIVFSLILFANQAYAVCTGGDFTDCSKHAPDYVFFDNMSWHPDGNVDGTNPIFPAAATYFKVNVEPQWLSGTMQSSGGNERADTNLTAAIPFMRTQITTRMAVHKGTDTLFNIDNGVPCYNGIQSFLTTLVYRHSSTSTRTDFTPAIPFDSISNFTFYITVYPNSTSDYVVYNHTTGTLIAGAYGIDNTGCSFDMMTFADSDEATGSIYYEFYVWNGTISQRPLVAAPSTTITINKIYPTESQHTNSFTGWINISATTDGAGANISKIWINDSRFALSSNNLSHYRFYNSSTFPDGIYAINITANDTGGAKKSEVLTFYIDTTKPTLTDYTNHSNTYSASRNLNVTTSIDYIYKVNITTTCFNGTVIYDINRTYNGTSLFSLNIADTINNTLCNPGNITTIIRVADSHTAKYIQPINHYISDKEIILQNTPLKIYPGKKEDFAAVSTTKITDRHTFEFTRSKIGGKTTDDFYIEGDNINPLSKSPYSGHFVVWNGFGNNYWIDFETNEHYPILVTKVTDKKYKVSVNCSKDGCSKNYKFKSIGGLNENNITVVWFADYGTNHTTTETYNSVIYVSTLETLAINITFNALKYRLNSATLEWNNTNYTAILSINDSSAISPHTHRYSYIVTVPSPSNGTKIIHTWFYNLTNLETNTHSLQKIYNQNQTVLLYYFDDCTLAKTEAIHFWIYNESAPSQKINASFSITIAYTSPDNVSTSFSYSKSSSYQYLFCIEPSNSIFLSNFTIQYYAGGTDLRDYTELLNTVSSTKQNISLYLLDVGLSSDVTIHVVNENDDDLENVVVEVWYDDVGTTTDVLVETDTTNNVGQVKFNLNLDSRYYFKLYQNNELKLQSSPAKITDTTIEFIIVETDESRFTDWIDIKKIIANITYNNNTNVVTGYYNDASNYSKIFFFKIENTNGTIVYNTSSTDRNHTFTYTIVALNQSYLATIYTQSWGWQNYVLATYGIDSRSLWRNLGFEGIMYCLIIFLTISLMGISYPELAIATGTISLFALYLMGIVSFPVSTLMWIISLAVIGIIAVVRNK